MDETDKKIRELTEAMRAEQDTKIRNRMMAVRGILAGYSTNSSWKCTTRQIPDSENTARKVLTPL